MSGFEIAGLVFGAMPILVTAADLLRAGYEKALIPFRKRRYIGTLANALLLQRQTVAETIRLLIAHCGCLYDDDLLRTQLDDGPSGYLKDEQVQSQILDFLGEKNHAALAGTLKEIHDIVAGVATGRNGTHSPGLSSASLIPF